MPHQHEDDHHTECTHHAAHETSPSAHESRLRRAGRATLQFVKDFVSEPDQEHDHDHAHGDPEIISSRRLNLLGAANLVIGAAEMTTAGAQAQVLALGDGGHNSGVDSITYTGQAAEQEGKKRGVRAWLGRHYRPFWFAGEALTLAASASSVLSDKETHTPNAWAVASVLGSAALNAAVFAKPIKTLISRAKQGHSLSHLEKDIIWHAGLDSSRVTAATIGLGLNALGLGMVEKVAGLAIGGAGTLVAGRSMVRANWERAKERFSLVSSRASLGFAAASFAIGSFCITGSETQHNATSLKTLPPASQPQLPAKPRLDKSHAPIHHIKVDVKPGEGLYSILAAQGVEPEDRTQVLKKITADLLRSGQVYRTGSDVRITKPGPFTLPAKSTQIVRSMANRG